MVERLGPGGDDQRGAMADVTDGRCQVVIHRLDLDWGIEPERDEQRSRADVQDRPDRGGGTENGAAPAPLNQVAAEPLGGMTAVAIDRAERLFEEGLRNQMTAKPGQHRSGEEHEKKLRSARGNSHAEFQGGEAILERRIDVGPDRQGSQPRALGTPIEQSWLDDRGPGCRDLSVDRAFTRQSH